jgi:hypothetical protein
MAYSNARNHKIPKTPCTPWRKKERKLAAINLTATIHHAKDILVSSDILSYL